MYIQFNYQLTKVFLPESRSFLCKTERKFSKSYSSVNHSLLDVKLTYLAHIFTFILNIEILLSMIA